MGRVIRAVASGVVEFVDADRIEIKLAKKLDKIEGDGVELSSDHKKLTYHLTKFWRTSQSTCYNQKVKVVAGEKIKVGDLLIDGPSCDDGDLALGQNLTVAYSSWGGYGFVDAILVSYLLFKDDLFTSINML